jgi:CysZ protein
MRDLFRGLRSIGTAIGMIAREPRVRRLAIAPLAINVVLVLVGLPLLIWRGVSIGGSLFTGDEAWAGPLRLVVGAVVAIVVSIVGLLALLVLARIAAAPLMSRLSEAVERAVLGDRYVPRQTTLRDDVADVGRGAMFALGRLLLFLVLYPLILVTGLIPAVGPILAPLATVLYGALVLSLDFSEPIFERHLPGFRRRLRHVTSRPLLYLGFGGASVAMALIPFANLAVLPVCVAAATIVFLGERPDGRQL